MTYNFRNKKPQRRTDVRVKEKYGSYRNDLKKDFYDRCGYCDCPRVETMENYHIDHFIPREKFVDAHGPAVLDAYSNLVYSCPHCNIQKSDTWPSDNIAQNVVENKGFVCPCSEDYETLFKRNSSGEIIPQTKLAEYIYSELKLSMARFSIIWKMEKINEQLQELEKQNIPELETLIGQLSRDYLKLLNEFKKAKKLKKFDQV